MLEVFAQLAFIDNTAWEAVRKVWRLNGMIISMISALLFVRRLNSALSMLALMKS